MGVFGPSNTAISVEIIQKQMQEQKLAPIKIDIRPVDEIGFKKLGTGRINAISPIVMSDWRCSGSRI